MAIKDWNKTRSKNINKIDYINNKKLIYLTIFTDHLWMNNAWKVNVMQIKNRKMNILSQNYFKTKQQALKFAKEYMRKH